MSDSNKYCIDIMQQNLAVIGLLRGAHKTLMEGHLKGCFNEAFSTKSEKKRNEMIDEILKVTRHTTYQYNYFVMSRLPVQRWFLGV